MPNIIPYRAFFYSQELAPELDKLVSPPYDVISPEQHLALVERHPYNSVGLCLPDSTEDPKRYQTMRARLQEWKQKQIFQTVPRAGFYLIEEKYEGKRRIGFIGLLEVSPFDEKKVLPHEYTLSGPKKDRLDLLTTMRAELSQIFLCYRDPKLTLEGIHEQKSKEKPFREQLEVNGVARKVWILDSLEHTEAIHDLLEDHPVLIADGHHRYETAVAFKSQDTSLGSKYAQCYFTNLDTPRFSILFEQISLLLIRDRTEKLEVFVFLF